jgi:hypothetical protein
MSTIFALLLIASGLAIMAFGLFFFYAWLPLLYALVGLDVGLLLGRSLTGEMGTMSIVFGIVGAVVLGAASYFLEPYRRIMIGAFGGVLFGISIATAFGFESWLGSLVSWLLALLCGVIGSVLVPRFFNLFIVCATAISGAAIAMTGANHLFPGVGLFDRVNGGVLPAILVLVLAVTGVVWQRTNIAKWGQLAVNQKG